MIEFQQTLTDKEYNKAFFKHYFKAKYRYLTPVLGYFFIILAIIAIIVGLAIGGDIILNAIVPIVIGLFFVLSPYLTVRSWTKNMKSSKLFSATTNYQITDDDKIIGTIGDNTSTTNLSDLHSFYNKGRFLMLYISKAQFFILDKQQLSLDQIEYITDKLKRLGIKED